MYKAIESVQLGDEFSPGIAEVSGMFDRLENLDTRDNRVINQER